jgi:hypothetical protein
MRLELLCPACGIRDLDFDDHENLVLLAPNLALVQFSCPSCGIHLSVTLRLTPEMQHRIRQRINAAADTDGVPDTADTADEATDTAGASTPPANETRATNLVPDPSILSYASNLVVDQAEMGIDFIRPLRAGSTEVKAHVEYFKRQLETVETVDEAIEEIDTGYYREKRDV